VGVGGRPAAGRDPSRRCRRGRAGRGPQRVAKPKREYYGGENAVSGVRDSRGIGRTSIFMGQVRPGRTPGGGSAGLEGSLSSTSPDPEYGCAAGSCKDSAITDFGLMMAQRLIYGVPRVISIFKCTNLYLAPSRGARRECRPLFRGCVRVPTVSIFTVPSCAALAVDVAIPAATTTCVARMAIACGRTGCAWAGSVLSCSSRAATPAV
jgi:hypothetical protein